MKTSAAWVVGIFLCSLSSAHASDSQDGCDETTFGVVSANTQYATSVQSGSVDVKSNEVRGPFRGLPPEIANIRRGAFSEFIGGFINDGLAYWLGVDIDHSEIISIGRRVWDVKAQRSRKFEFPDVKANTSSAVVRTWTNENSTRKEMETVRRSPLSKQELTDFICAANAEWAYVPPPQNGPVMPSFRTDTLSSLRMLVNVKLTDSGEKVLVTKTIEESGATWAVANALERARRDIWQP